MTTTPLDGAPWTGGTVDDRTQQAIDHNAALAAAQVTQSELDALTAARTTWAAAGGATPSITAIDPFTLFTEADPTFGTGAVKDNSWHQVGKEASGHLRINFGTGMTPGEGFYVPTGFPALPKITQSGAPYARCIGSGTCIDSSAGSRATPIYLFIDSNVDATRPFFFVPWVWADIVIDAGTVTVMQPNPLPILAHNNPFTFADGDAINITFAFETV